MFVCNCNGVRMRDMASAVESVACSHAPSTDAVYAACGVTPKCGRCRVDIRRMLDDATRPALLLAAE
jgi:bacterioferritin-associated ferredoxin